MAEFLREIWSILRGIDIYDAIDIALVTFVNYKLLMMIRGTRAWRIVIGALAFVLLLYLSNKAGLTTLHWILDKAAILAPVALVILLLPELRYALEGLTRLRIGSLEISLEAIAGVEKETEARTIEEVVAAIAELASTRVGAIIVIERGAALDEIASNGVPLDAKVSAALLGSIFHEGNPLHDGAAVIRGDRVVSAACRLPLSESLRVDPTLHMRHRAALGVAEAFDCIAIVVSEERGTISIAHNARIYRLADHAELRKVLNRELRGEEPELKARPRLRVRPRVEAKR